MQFITLCTYSVIYFYTCTYQLYLSAVPVPIDCTCIAQTQSRLSRLTSTASCSPALVSNNLLSPHSRELRHHPHPHIQQGSTKYLILESLDTDKCTWCQQIPQFPGNQGVFGISLFFFSKTLQTRGPLAVSNVVVTFQCPCLSTRLLAERWMRIYGNFFATIFNNASNVLSSIL